MNSIYNKNIHTCYDIVHFIIIIKTEWNVIENNDATYLNAKIAAKSKDVSRCQSGILVGLIQQVLNAGEGALQVLQVDDDWVRHNLLQAEHY